jgi:flagellar biosynthesis/type III secretory pathway chaperone
MNAQTGQRLKGNLQQHLDCTAVLQSALDEEHRALTANDAESLLQVTQTKAAAAETLRALGDELIRLQRDSSCTSIDALLATADAEGLSPQWNEILERATQCHRANRRNAALLDVRQTQVRAALELIFPTQVAQTYGRSGHSGGPVGTRSFGLA